MQAIGKCAFSFLIDLLCDLFVRATDKLRALDQAKAVLPRQKIQAHVGRVETIPAIEDDLVDPILLREEWQRLNERDLAPRIKGIVRDAQLSLRRLKEKLRVGRYGERPLSKVLYNVGAQYAVAALPTAVEEHTEPVVHTNDHFHFSTSFFSFSIPFFRPLVNISFGKSSKRGHRRCTNFCIKIMHSVQNPS